MNGLPRLKCECPVRCKFCGAKRRRDIVGHYCPTHNCQWQHGYETCTPVKRKSMNKEKEV